MLDLESIRCSNSLKPHFQSDLLFAICLLNTARKAKIALFSLHPCSSVWFCWSTKPEFMWIFLLVVEPSGGSQRYQAHTGPRSEPRAGCSRSLICFSSIVLLHRGPTSEILLWILAWTSMKNEPWNKIFWVTRPPLPRAADSNAHFSFT